MRHKNTLRNFHASESLQNCIPIQEFCQTVIIISLTSFPTFGETIHAFVSRPSTVIDKKLLARIIYVRFVDIEKHEPLPSM